MSAASIVSGGYYDFWKRVNNKIMLLSLLLLSHLEKKNI
jgi:hypothetical protein